MGMPLLLESLAAEEDQTDYLRIWMERVRDEVARRFHAIDEADPQPLAQESRPAS